MKIRQLALTDLLAQFVKEIVDLDTHLLGTNWLKKVRVIASCYICFLKKNNEFNRCTKVPFGIKGLTVILIPH